MASVVITARAMLFAEGDDALVSVLVRAVSLSGLGALTYVVSHFVLWQLAGRSAGVETAALGLVSGRRAGG